jgi:putative oxidoreductase
MTLPTFLHKPIFKSPLALIRIWLGVTFIHHGIPGIFSADFMDGHIGMMEFFDMPMPILMAYLSKGIELFAGICLLLGLFTRLAAGLIALSMLVAIVTALSGGIFDDWQEEISFTYFILALALFLKGSTDFSLDRQLFSV